MLLGYARVSTTEQDTMLQLVALKKAGCDRIYEEHKSGGAGVVRPQLQALFDALREGDTVVVYKIDRLARSLSDLLRILGLIEATKAEFKSLTEAVDTSTISGKMMMQMLGAFAEFERGMIRERSLAGLRAAQARGVRCGRRPSLTDSEAIRAAEMYRNGQSTLTALGNLYGCHMSSIKRAIARADALRGPGRGPYPRPKKKGSAAADPKVGAVARG